MTDALKAGVNRVDGISFFVSDPKKYREGARLKAVQAAREKATAMAAQLGQSIGKPWDVTEQADADAGEPMTANSIFGFPHKQPQEEATVAGGEVTIRAIVRVSFLLE